MLKHPITPQVPFTKSFRATIRSHASLLRTPHDQCEAVQDMDCWGNDLVQKYGVKSAGDCCNLCRNSSQCGAYTFHPDGTCFLKTRCGGMQPSKGNTTGSLNSWSVLEGVAFPGASAVATPQPAAAVSDCAAACDAAAVQATGHAQAPCKAFTYDAERKLCTLLNGTTGGQVPSSTFIASGCRGCEDTAGAGGFDDSVFVLVRGFYGKAGVDIRIGDVTVPSSARLVTQENNALLQPLDYYDLLSLNNATHGLVLMTTLSVLSGTANFMEVRRRRGLHQMEKRHPSILKKWMKACQQIALNSISLLNFVTGMFSLLHKWQDAGEGFSRRDHGHGDRGRPELDVSTWKMEIRTNEGAALSTGFILCLLHLQDYYNSGYYFINA